MSYFFVPANDDVFRVNSTPITSYPISISLWFKLTAPGNIHIMAVEQRDTTSEDVLAKIGIDPTGNVTAGSRQGGQSSVYAIATEQAVAGVWYHVFGRWPSNSKREIWLNGGNYDDETTTINPTSIDTITVSGAEHNNDVDKWMDGWLAEIGIWNTALTDAEIKTLARGYSPRFIRPGNLKVYYPFTNNAKDKVGLYNLSVDSGAPALSRDNPPLITLARKPVRLGAFHIGELR